MNMILTIFLLTVSLLLPSVPSIARDYAVNGPLGGISMTVTLPDGFDTSRDNCPMVILMHVITRHRKEVVGQAVSFFKQRFEDPAMN